MLHNAVTTVKGNTLTVAVDLSGDLGPSTTGKTILVAKGKDEIQDGMFLSLNVYKYPPKNGGNVRTRKRN